MIQLLIVADQPAMQKGLHMRMAAEADFAVIGEALDCTAAIDLAKLLCPDVVLIDGDMQRMEGFATAKALQSDCPQIGVILLSMHDDALTCERAIGAGVAAFIIKSMPSDILPSTIRQLASKKS
jgi:DNA-binding NarL/FixJ family response regulator